MAHYRYEVVIEDSIQVVGHNQTLPEAKKIAEEFGDAFVHDTSTGTVWYREGTEWTEESSEHTQTYGTPEPRR